jgi:Mor family transcriptional regulator
MNLAPAKTARSHPEDARAQLHAELTGIVRREIGMNENFASAHAAAILRGLCETLGGNEVYIPAPDRSARNASIRAEFKGSNADELCLKHGISRATLYRIAG